MEISKNNQSTFLGSIIYIPYVLCFFNVAFIGLIVLFFIFSKVTAMPLNAKKPYAPYPSTKLANKIEFSWWSCCSMCNLPARNHIAERQLRQCCFFIYSTNCREWSICEDSALLCGVVALGFKLRNNIERSLKWLI